MGFGIARAAQGLRFASALAVACLIGAAGPSHADDQIPTTPLSKLCEAPAQDIAVPEPLPNTAARLRERKPLRVLAIGSSSTVGIGASGPTKSYPAQLERILERAFSGLDVVIVNRGVSGEVAAQTADRLKVQVALEEPNLVLWQVGTNDALAHVPVNEFIDTVRETIDWLKEHHIDVVIVGLQYTPKLARDEYYAAIRSRLRQLTQQEGVVHVRRFEAMEFLDHAAVHEELLSEDGLHLNDLGYQCMAEHVARAVVVSTFLRGARPKPVATPLQPDKP